ncbi:hypothetical protein AB0C69_39565, partial [Actinomadura sp. NPDC048032]|uniref:hypothetical protein n=1 Tax=Actinomadura sp. NPDC048032 TaxID=3155747 RepID=UPI0033FF07B0
MAAAHPLLLARLPEPLGAVRGDRFEQPVPRPLARHDERPVDEARERLDVGAADRLGRVEGAAARVDRQPPQHRPLALLQGLPAPVDQGAERALPGRGVPGAGRQQPEAVVQPFGQAGDAERPHPRRRQLQGQRDAVEAVADRGDRLGLPRAGRQARPLGEQRGCGPGVQRRDGPEPLPRDRQRLPASGEDPQVRDVAQQRRRQPRHRLGHVLAVVEDQQRPPAAERLAQPRGRSAAGTRVVAQPEHPGGERRRVVGGRARLQPLVEPHEPHLAGAAQGARDGHREPGLAHPAHPVQRHEARLLQQRGQFPDGRVPADEGRHVRGQVASRPADRRVAAQHGGV